MTAPLTRRGMMVQVQGNHPTENAVFDSYQYWWQGNGWSIVYSALFQALTAWGAKQMLHRMPHRMASSKGGGGNKLAQEPDHYWPEKQRAQLWVQCATMTILYPLIKVTTVLTTSTAPTTTRGALAILSEAVSSQGWVLGLYGGLGSMIASHIQYQTMCHGMMMWRARIRIPQRTGTTIENGAAPKTEAVRWDHLAERVRSHLRLVVILGVSTCFAYPLETSSRRQQIPMKSSIPSVANDVNLWSGVGYKVLATVTYHSILGLYNSDTCSIFFRRVMMKFFH